MDQGRLGVSGVVPPGLLQSVLGERTTASATAEHIPGGSSRSPGSANHQHRNSALARRSARARPSTAPYSPPTGRQTPPTGSPSPGCSNASCPRACGLAEATPTCTRNGRGPVRGRNSGPSARRAASPLTWSSTLRDLDLATPRLRRDPAGAVCDIAALAGLAHRSSSSACARSRPSRLRIFAFSAAARSASVSP